MAINFRTLRLVCSGALVGVAVAGILGVDTSSLVASFGFAAIGAGSTLIAIKSLAII
ncbi:hypothetical protein HX870_00535 [Pseudomonas gingeri]|uniref:Uncharacterized protein n=1 Tax=Pseudomonas gingeri TaxID=117681 RepID=A0A7Y7XC34_9PSED|nr:hypothetical protein [Pseudomonas gingeri]NWB97154.1 hypothetical protein [Pseudomonas gingeri]NWD66106.1 hypothetical protein [Pseudomonas gingeri]NWD73526.1 hypothetical protein [Pseudomonas gingeri]